MKKRADGYDSNEVISQASGFPLDLDKLGGMQFSFLNSILKEGKLSELALLLNSVWEEFNPNVKTKLDSSELMALLDAAKASALEKVSETDRVFLYGVIDNVYEQLRTILKASDMDSTDTRKILGKTVDGVIKKFVSDPKKAAGTEGKKLVKVFRGDSGSVRNAARSMSSTELSKRQFDIAELKSSEERFKKLSVVLKQVKRGICNQIDGMELSLPNSILDMDSCEAFGLSFPAEYSS